MSEFRHEALVYDGPEAFANRVGPFVADGLRAGEPVMVMTPPDRIDALRSYLGRDAERVRFADMTEVGRNPARIIPAWAEFAAEFAGRPMRGVGEPAWAGRDPDELDECRLHESLLNLAFANGTGFWLACPYDGTALDAAVLADAQRTHPHADGGSIGSYAGFDGASALFSAPLPPAPATAPSLSYSTNTVREVRAFADRFTNEHALSQTAAVNFALTAHELAINSVLHGGGSGTISVWPSPERLTGEVRDAGRIDHLLVGRIKPPAEQEGGRGVWLANQLCDLVQLRSGPDGTVVRFSVSR